MRAIASLHTIVAVTLLAGSLSLAENPVHFDDPHLKAAVEERLRKSNPTPTDMLGLTRLDGTANDLTGLEYATNLEDLYLFGDQISDLSPLAGLTHLTYLILSGQINDLSPLGGLINLKYLDLYSAQIADISPLAGLINLKCLYLYSAQIADISPLAGLTSLERLDLSDNQISDISPLTGMTHMVKLRLHNNRISDIPTLVGWTHLESLELHNNQIGDVSGLGGLTNVTYYLTLYNNQISDITPLAGLIALQYLDLNNNQITDISPLAGLINLEELYLNNNQISSIPPLSLSTFVADLWLSDNQITDISGLSGLTVVCELNLSNNQITDISALSGLYMIRVDLRGNPLNQQACNFYIPMIIANHAGNPNPLRLYYDPCKGPTITQHPRSQTVSDGDSVTFTVSATGDGPLSYQWRKDGLNISGATSSSCTINSVSRDDAGSYYCVVTDTYGSATSNTATLTIAGERHTLTVTSTTGGSVIEPGEGSFQYDPGTSISILAQADQGHRFVNWTGSAVDAGRVANSSRASTTLTVDADYTLEANFESAEPRIGSLDISSMFGGKVTQPGEGRFVGLSGEVTVSAVADDCAKPELPDIGIPIGTTADCPWSRFYRWSGTAVDAGKVADPSASTTTVFVDGDYTLQAHFIVQTMVIQIGSIWLPIDTAIDINPLISLLPETSSIIQILNPIIIIEPIRIKGRLAPLTIISEFKHPGQIDSALLGLGTSPQFRSLELFSDFAFSENEVTYDDFLHMSVIDANGSGPVVLVEGDQSGPVTLSGFILTGANAGGNAIVDSNGVDLVLENCVICGNVSRGADGVGMSFTDCNATFINCTIVDNIGDPNTVLMHFTDANGLITNSIIWNNEPHLITSNASLPKIVYSDIQGGRRGQGTISVDPLFAAHGHFNNSGTPDDLSDDIFVMGDYHLQSRMGRYDPVQDAWVLDNDTSPCLNVGDPASPLDDEALPNGGRIDMGAYGGTSQASLSLQERPG